MKNGRVERVSYAQFYEIKKKTMKINYMCLTMSNIEVISLCYFKIVFHL